MLTVDEARTRIVGRAPVTDPERVALADAIGRVLHDPRVVAPTDVPPFDNSAMDGFAIRAADAPGPLRITGEVAAGLEHLPVIEPGTAVRIMTGAPVPPGADAVVPIEEAAEEGGEVTVPDAVRRGAHVRRAGHDTRAGDEVCLTGEMAPPKIAVLASLGIASVEVKRRPRVAILSTGDELVGPGEPLGPGQIHDANGVALAAAVRDAGGEPVVLPRQRDDEGAIERALLEAAESADVVVASGGVSVGRHDLVRAVIERRGALDFWRIAVQPGKPLAVGEVNGTTVVGLPGNPVSALVTFELFVRPLLRAALGLAGDGRMHIPAIPTERIGKDPDRRAFLRVAVEGDGSRFRARPVGGQLSSQLRPMAAGNGLLVVPEGAEAAETDRAYEAILLEPIAMEGAG